MRSVLYILLIVSLHGRVMAGTEYKRDIEPIFRKHCYECHSEGKKKEKGGVVFDNVDRLKGDIGPNMQIWPGEPGRSNLLELVVLKEGAKKRMPPDGSGLSAAEIKKLRQWISEGAALTDEEAVAAAREKAEAEKAAKKTAAIAYDWTDSEGRSMKAVFLKLEGDNIHVRKSDGKSYKIPLNKLSEESKNQALKLAAEAARGIVEGKKS